MTDLRTPLPQPFLDTAQKLAEIRDCHPKWAAQFKRDEPVYSIPLPAIKRLSLPLPGGGPPLFDSAAAEAERAFTHLCEARLLVGFQTDGPIPFQLLVPGHFELGPIAAACNKSPSELDAVSKFLDAGTERRSRLRGIVGWLLSEPMFLLQLGEIRRLYEDISTSARPRFPVGRVLIALDVDGGEPFQRFAHELIQFLDRWGLMSLASWDLPDPQGPLLPNPLSPRSLARPEHGVWVYIPAHYPLKGDDELQKQIVQFQHNQVTALGIDPSFAGISHYRTYDWFFQIIHLERAIQSRVSRPPRGLVARILDAASASLKLSVERVQKLRKMISRCRSGRRASIKDLHVRD